MITQEYLKECLDYNPTSGLFTWKARPREHFNTEKGWKVFNASYATKVAGSELKPKTSKTTYITISIDGQRYLAHRLAWLYCYGEIAIGDIDHHDRNGLNNSIENLAEVSRQQNQRNHPVRSNNTSGVMGVSWCRRDNKWQSRIWVDGKNISLGRFVDFDDAVAARKAAEKKYGFHENHNTEAAKLRGGE